MEEQPEEITCSGGITLRLSAGDIREALQENPEEGDPE